MREPEDIILSEVWNRGKVGGIEKPEIDVHLDQCYKIGLVKRGLPRLPRLGLIYYVLIMIRSASCAL